MLWLCCFSLLQFIRVVSLGLNQVPWLKAKVNDRKKWLDGILPNLVASDANSCLFAEELQTFCCRRGSGNTRNNLASYLLGCVGVRHSKAEKCSVQCMREIALTGVNIVSVFVWRFYMWCYFRSLRIVIIIIHRTLLKVLTMLWIWAFVLLWHNSASTFSHLAFSMLLSVRLWKLTVSLLLLLVVAWAPCCLGLELSFSLCCLLNFSAGAYLRTNLQF